MSLRFGAVEFLVHIMENPCWSRCSFPRLTWPALFTKFEGFNMSRGGGGRARKQFSKCNKCQTFNCNRNLFVLFFVRRFVAMQSFSNTAIQSNSRRTQRFHRQTRYDFSESWLALLSKKAHAARRTHNIVLALQLPY